MYGARAEAVHCWPRKSQPAHTVICAVRNVTGGLLRVLCKRGDPSQRLGQFQTSRQTLLLELVAQMLSRVCSVRAWITLHFGWLSGRAAFVAIAAACACAHLNLAQCLCYTAPSEHSLTSPSEAGARAEQAQGSPKKLVQQPHGASLSTDAVLLKQQPAGSDTVEVGVKAVADRSHMAFTEGAFTGAPHPVNEEERMCCLNGLNVLDTPPDKRFDDITRLASAIFKVRTRAAHPHLCLAGVRLLLGPKLIDAGTYCAGQSGGSRAAVVQVRCGPGH